MGMAFRRMKKPQPDFTAEAIGLFTRFATRHGLSYNSMDAPVEALWEFPVQEKLAHRIVLGLQNNDELNFGVGGFWSYFFPYSDKCSSFERLIDSWVEGRARIVPRNSFLLQRYELQVSDGDGWKVEYAAMSLGLRKPNPAILTNVPAL
jgi:hypothetical protein